MRIAHDTEMIKEEGTSYYNKLKEEYKDYPQFDNYIKSLETQE